jgi:hypothetical protein
LPGGRFDGKVVWKKLRKAAEKKARDFQRGKQTAEEVVNKF